MKTVLVVWLMVILSGCVAMKPDVSFRPDGAIIMNFQLVNKVMQPTSMVRTITDAAGPDNRRILSNLFGWD